ncbi:trypsin-like peptidase domain-containing protein [Candidatus Nomurabacteria bacterium]|nr:trypsin-like peptidase domain-containing protein [Candidatus Nomurabacteria bacterium]
MSSFPRNFDHRVVFVSAESGLGAGFIVEEGIITSWHVVSDCQNPLIIMWDGSQLESSVVRHDFITDLALLKFKAHQDISRFSISSGTKFGEKVRMIGHPWGEPWVLVDGKVLLPNTLLPTSDSLISIFHAPGFSGSPVFNESEEVVGVLKAGLGPAITTNAKAIRAFLDE